MSLWRRIYIERRRIALPVLVILVANVAVLALGVFPLKKIVASEEQRATDALIKLRDARLNDQKAKQARASKEQAEQQLKKFYAEILPTNHAAAGNLAVFWVMTTATESNLKFKSGGSEAEPADKDSSLMRYGAKAILTGDYPNIRRFLYAVETAPEFIIIDDVRLSQPNQLQGSSGALEVILEIATYFLAGRAGGQ